MLVPITKQNMHVTNALIPPHVIHFHAVKSDNRAMWTLYIISLSLLMKQNTGIITVVHDKKSYTEISSKVTIIASSHREIYPNGSYKKTTRSLIHFVWNSGKLVHFWD